MKKAVRNAIIEEFDYEKINPFSILALRASFEVRKGMILFMTARDPDANEVYLIHVPVNQDGLKGDLPSSYYESRRFKDGNLVAEPGDPWWVRRACDYNARRGIVPPLRSETSDSEEEPEDEEYSEEELQEFRKEITKVVIHISSRFIVMDCIYGPGDDEDPGYITADLTESGVPDREEILKMYPNAEIVFRHH